MKRHSGWTFVVIGVAFLAISFSGQPAFLGIGIAMIAVGIALRVRQKRAGGSK